MSGASEASFVEQHAWTTHLDAFMTTPRRGFAAVAMDGEIIVVGGRNGDDVLSSVARSTVLPSLAPSKDDTCKLNLSRWSAMPSTITPRRWFGAAVVPPYLESPRTHTKPNVLIVGGYTTGSPSAACAEAEVLDSSNQWRKLPSMHTKRGSCAVASWRSSDGSGKGGVYVVGGYDGRKFLGSVECLSFPARDAARGPSWTLLASDMKRPRVKCAAVVVEGGGAVRPTARNISRQLVVMGGRTDKLATNSVEAYDFETGQWEELPPMTEERYECAAVAMGQCIYVVGGSNGKESLATAEYFDLRTRRWTLLPPMSKRRWGCAAVVVNGHMLVLGGYDGSTNLQSLESVRIAVDDTPLHKVELPDLPPPTAAVGARNRIQQLEKWCDTVEKLLAEVKADIDERKEIMEATKGEEVTAAAERCEVEIKALEARCEQEIKTAEEKFNFHMAALESGTDEWVRVTRQQLQAAQLEMEGLRPVANKRNTNMPPSNLQVFIRDAEGDRVPLVVSPDDYAALKRLAAAELNLSPDDISKFRRKSDGGVIKSDRHMAILCRNDDLEVLTNSSALSQPWISTSINGGSVKTKWSLLEKKFSN